MAKVPSERSLAKKYSDRPFALLGVNADDASDDLAKRTADAGITWRSFQDGRGGPIATDWAVTALPTTYLIDQDGIVYAKDLSGDKLEAAIEELVLKAEGE